MHPALPWDIVALYTAYGMFSSQQKFCRRDLKNESAAFRLAIGYFALPTALFGFGYLVYYGIKISWWAPIVLFALVVCSMLPVALLERFIPLKIWGLASFVAIPVLAYLLVIRIPIQ